MNVGYAGILSRLSVRKLNNRPMREFTSLRVGGKADVIFFPADMAELKQILALAKAEGLPFYPLGGGTNLLVKDKGIRGAVISLTCGFNYLSIEEHDNEKLKKLRVGAGTNMGRACLYAMRNCLAGLEGLVGIPGTVGGCLTTNAGTKNRFIGEAVEKVIMLNEDGKEVVIQRDEIDFSYRKAVYPLRGIIIECEFILSYVDELEVRGKMLKAACGRSASKKISLFNAGSIFKNPPGYSAGALIEQCNLKGLTEGDALISPLHGNIIINRGTATADDVLRLIAEAKEAVVKNFGIELEEEIKIIGE